MSILNVIWINEDEWLNDRSCSMGLFGDQVVKFFLRDNTISINVCSVNHILQDSIIGEFSQILGNLSEILESDKTFVIGFLPVLWRSY
jgi:hypothetical protein